MSRYGNHADHELRSLLATPEIGEPVKRKVRAELARRRGQRDTDAPETTASYKAKTPTTTGNPERHITLPWSLLKSANQRHGVMNGQIMLTREYRKAKESATLAITAQVSGEPFQGPVSARYDFYPPDRRRRDMANLRKLTDDCMEGSMYADDSQIVEAHEHRHEPDRDNPRVEVRVRPLDNKPAA